MVADGCFVAYGLCCKYGGDTTLWRFYVRRLRDNAEDWVADRGDLHGVDVHWVQPVKAEKTDARGLKNRIPRLAKTIPDQTRFIKLSYFAIEIPNAIG